NADISKKEKILRIIRKLGFFLHRYPKALALLKKCLGKNRYIRGVYHRAMLSSSEIEVSTNIYLNTKEQRIYNDLKVMMAKVKK
ncbi:hypothetical protein AB4351_21865, partial [Vibrio sp. 10N.261.51.F11]|uniref:hypothetical protein n=1 Tax=Vibrio sp. 10N.261.51.F11 TaxID=3229678 RepID=UPI00354B772E